MDDRHRTSAGPNAGPAGVVRIPEVTPPDRSEAWACVLARDDRGLPLWVLALALAAALGLAASGAQLLRLIGLAEPPLPDSAAIGAIVERIIVVESDADANARNKRSSATGAGQFLDATWLEMIRLHRPDLARGRSEKQVLELRRETALAREIATRWVERNAAMLSRKGMRVTPGALYLTYFAGPAGALAILSVPEHVDAASVMAGADASGRTTREQIVNANPFLGAFTVGDLKNWADRKMRGL
jgi:hypothetical protein